MADDLKRLQKCWDSWGKKDPLWAILSYKEKKGRKWMIDEFFKTGIKEIQSVLKYIKSKGIKLNRGKALDFGCGIGRLTQPLAQNFKKAYGVDIAPSMIKLAKKYNKHGKKCEYILNKADNLKIFKGSSIDFIYSHITLQHIKPKYSLKYIKEFFRILAPNGILLFQIPSKIKNPLYIIFKLYSYFKSLVNLPYMEIHSVKKKNIVKLAKENHADIIDIIETGSVPGYTSYRYCIKKIVTKQ